MCICTYLVHFYLQSIISHRRETGVGQGGKLLEIELVLCVGSYIKEKEL